MGRTSKRSCVNMEELMQFEAARQRALTQTEHSVKENPFTEFMPYRIFINNIDTFNGSHLATYLSNVTRQEHKEIPGEVEEYEKGYDEVDTEINDLSEGGTVSQSTVKESEITYEIMGSLEFLNNPHYVRPNGISELLDNENKSEFLTKLLTCGFIVYDITSDLHCHPKQVEEAKWVLENIVKRLEIFEKHQKDVFLNYTHRRVFILISTLLTWAKTKPIDPNDPSLPFTERDFRKRKPHPNYKIHWELEKRVIELGKKYPRNLRTIVIGSGIPYGHEEDVLHFLFKLAWQDSPFLPIFKPGKNLIPVLHIDSLVAVVHAVIENFPEKYRYIIATDPHSVTLKQITKLLAKQLGNGKTKLVDREEAFLFPDIKQRNYDMLTANINIVPGFTLKNPLLKWGTDLPFAENIPLLINQFKTSRELSPIKIFIHGPPASGKTYLANRLCLYYDIPRLHEQGIIDETINSLKEKIKEKTEAKEQPANEEKVEIEGDEPEEEKEEEEQEEEEEGDTLEMLEQKLREIEDNMEKNGNNKLDDELVLRFFKEKLNTNACKNKGYVIDGYPETLEQTKTLYAAEGGEEEAEEEDWEEQGGDVTKMCNMTIMPAFVESLDASDEYLINRMIRLPVPTITELEEHEMCRRLTEFRALNTEDNTPLIFYDEMEVHPMIYNIENDTDVHMKPTFEAIINHVGPPHNYGTSPPTTDDIFAESAKEKAAAHLESLKAQRDEAKKAAEERRQNFEKWMFLKNQELEMEEKALLLMGMPLRHYLMKYVFPCLTRGLVEVARVRPDDPVDFLSEFLFRENPEGKMFQPNPDERDEKLEAAIREYEGKGQRDSSKSTKSFSTEKSVVSDAVSRVTGYKCSYVTTPTSKSALSKTSRAKSGTKSGSEGSSGVCTCQKSPSLSTCSSDRTVSTASSCVCPLAEPCEPCEPCEPEAKEEDPCKCPCLK